MKSNEPQKYQKYFEKKKIFLKKIIFELFELFWKKKKQINKINKINQIKV